MASQFVPRDKVWVKYNLRSQAKLWHARVILSQVGVDQFRILTPDGDTYVEDYGPDQKDVLDFKKDEPLVNLGSDKRYDFDEFPGDRDLALAIAKAQVEDIEEGYDFELVHFQPPQRAGERGALRDVPADSHGRDRKAPGVVAPSDGLAALRDSLCDYRAGGEREPRVVLPPDGPLPGNTDFRVLPLVRDEIGQQYRRFEDAVKILSRAAWPSDWPLKGPQTLLWVVLFMITNATSPIQWHLKWKTMCKLQDSDAMVSTHAMICRFIEMTISYDQLDVTQIAGCEFMVRHLQMIEDRWKDRVLSDTSKATGAHLFTGIQDIQALCICPALNEWIAEELRKESAVLKEERKAREERKQQKA